jgi:HlyD family secretion protein
MDHIIRPPAWHRWRWPAAVMAGVAVLVALWLKPATGVHRLERSEVVLGQVSRGILVRDIRASGVLEAAEQQVLAAESAGQVVRVVLANGAIVAPGSEVLELENADVRQQARSAAAALTQAEIQRATLRLELNAERLQQDSEVARAASEFKLQQLRVRGETELAAKGIVSRQQLLESQGQLEQLERSAAVQLAKQSGLVNVHRLKLRASDDTLAERREAAQQLQARAAGLIVRASVAGTLDGMSVRAGEAVQAGATLARVVVPGALRANLGVAQGQAGALQIGQAVVIRSAGSSVTGSISAISPSVTEGRVAVLVSFDPSGGAVAELKPGQVVEGRVVLETLPAALRLPRPAAVQQDGQLLRLFRRNGARFTATNVQLGRLAGDYVEVLTGLNVGDEVILSDTSAIAGQSNTVEPEIALD